MKFWYEIIEAALLEPMLCAFHVIFGGKHFRFLILERLSLLSSMRVLFTWIYNFGTVIGCGLPTQHWLSSTKLITSVLFLAKRESHRLSSSLLIFFFSLFFGFVEENSERREWNIMIKEKSKMKNNDRGIKIELV